MRRKYEINTVPARVCLNAAIAKGGKVSTPILMAKKVVPQNMETAQKASQAMALGDKFNGLLV